jgi:ESF2/ABP1 family protein
MNDDDDLKNVDSASIDYDDDDDDNDVDGSDSEPEEEDKEETEEETETNETTIKKPRKIHKLSMTETENFNKKLKKRGVVYIARVPPRMTPTKIKSLLSDFGEVTRVFLVEEDASKRKRRRQEFGNSGGKRYIEGWVEFASKRKAKHVALSLNTTPISVHKRNPHCGK